MTLTEFLLARIAEDEAVALEATSPDYAGGGYGLELGGLVLAECEAKRLLIADLTSERHEVVDDCWYTCAAATEEHDGGDCCDESRGEDCDCGLDNRVVRRLGLLALPYADHSNYRREWKP